MLRARAGDLLSESMNLNTNTRVVPPAEAMKIIRVEIKLLLIAINRTYERRFRSACRANNSGSHVRAKYAKLALASVIGLY